MTDRPTPSQPSTSETEKSLNDPGSTSTSHSTYLPETLQSQSDHGSLDSKDKLSRFLKGKEREWAAATNKNHPLNILDLPTDILRLIIKEVGN